MPENVDRQWISVNEAAEYLGCHRNTIFNHFRKGRLTKYRVGPRRIVLDFAEVQDLARPKAVNR